MAESKILSNIDYNIHNYSNFDLTTEETRDIVDIPFFPSQNLVDIGGIEVINLNPNYWFLLKDSNNNYRVFGMIEKEDVRLTFVELSNNARYYQYRFSGNSFPQGRTKYSLFCDGRKIYIGFGECNNRYVNDLWIYDIYTNTWENINYSIQELPIDEVPSRRGKVNLVVLPSSLWIFGGETDILKIHSEAERNKNIVPLNDLWYYDFSTKQWYNLDPYRMLPHRQGNIIYIDNSIVKILVKGGLNNIGVEEPTAIWTYDRNTHNVTYESFSPPFDISYNNQAFFIDGAICYLINGVLYKWDNISNTFNVIKTNLTTIHQDTKDYLLITSTSKNRGDDALIGECNVTEAKIYNFTNDTLLEEKTIIPPVDKVEINRINIDNYQTWFMYGIANTDTNSFNEAIFSINHQTLQTTKYTFNSDEKPQERIYPSLCYDRVHSKIWLFGGTDGTRFYNDLWYFDLNSQTWTKEFDGEGLDNNNDFPAPRQKAGICCVVNGRYIYVLGGYSDTHTFNDFWQYDTITKKWTRMYLSDNIPYGSEYYIFEWRDRLWLFNGEIDGIYRFFYSTKQFVKQYFVFRGENISNELKTIIQQKQYLEVPITFTLINDYMFIQNNQVNLRINLETRVVDDLYKDFGLKLNEPILWLDIYKGFLLKTGKLIYINYSELYPITKNQIPSSLYYKDVNDAGVSALFLKDFINTNQLSYYDDSGIYKIENRRIPLDKSELLVDRLIEIAGSESDYPDVSFDNDNSVWNKTLEVISSPKVYPVSYWFLYKKNKMLIDFYKGAIQVIEDKKRKRLFIVYDSGEILKLNTHDNTMFAYYPHFWKGSVIAYNKLKGKFWCFGGLRREERTPYTQMGFECSPLVTSDCVAIFCSREEQTHCGVVELDINVNELSLRSIVDYARENKVSLIDYNITREYLIGLIEEYINQYETNRINLSLNEIKKKVYESTKPLVDDISTLDIVYEKGDRPFARGYMSYTQIENKVYMFGGCTSFIKKSIGLPMLCAMGDNAPDLTCKYGKILNEPYFVNPVGLIQPQPMSGSSTAMDEYNNAKYAAIERGKEAYVYDLNNDKWTKLASLPKWLYMSSAIASLDGRYIYIVGGYSDYMLTNPSKDIYLYDTYTNSYTHIYTPKKFKPRARPILHWMDENRLLIMYGFVSRLVPLSIDESVAFWLHLPVNDAWVYDTKNKIMYQAFQDLISMGGVHIKDYFIDENDIKTSKHEQYVVAPVPIQYEDEIKIIVYKYNLLNGDIDIIPINPTTEILNSFSFKIVDTINGGEFQKIT